MIGTPAPPRHWSREPRLHAGVLFCGTRMANPRVAGSIPALATISNSMIRNGLRVSPADHPWPLMADPRTIGKWVGGETRRGGGGKPEIWEPRDLASRNASLYFCEGDHGSDFNAAHAPCTYS